MPTTHGFDHVATVTADLDRVVGFYRTVFNAKVTFEMAATPTTPAWQSSTSAVAAPWTSPSSPGTTARSSATAPLPVAAARLTTTASP